MYSPQLSDEMVRTLWKLKQIYKRPMTKLADELIKKGLEVMAKEAPAPAENNGVLREHGNGMVGIQLFGTRGM